MQDIPSSGEAACVNSRAMAASDSSVLRDLNSWEMGTGNWDVLRTNEAVTTYHMPF